MSGWHEDFGDEPGAEERFEERRMYEDLQSLRQELDVGIDQYNPIKCRDIRRVL